MKVGKIKQLSKKSLSVLLAVIMIMTSMSVCFGTVTFAASTNATEAQWSALEAALKNDTVKGAAFTGSKYTYTVNDPDGKIIDAVEEWWTVFNAVKENVGDNAGSNNFRTAVQVNQAIKDTLSSRMAGNYATYNVENFLSGLIAGVTASDIQSGVSPGRENTNQNASVSTDLTAAQNIVLTVKLGGELLSYNSLDELPPEIATTKTFTIQHRNTNFDNGYFDQSGSCGGSTRYYTWKYYYVINSATAAEGAKQSTQVLKDSKKTLDDNSAYLNATLDQMVGYINADASAVAAAQTAINGAKAAAVAFSQAAWDRYFSTAYDTKITAMNSNVTLATEIVSVGNVALGLVNLKDAGYAGMDEDALKALYAQLTTGLDTFDKATQTAKDYITNAGFVRADIEAFAKLVEREVQLIKLRELKATIDSTVPPYADYNEDKVISGEVTGATLSAAKGTVNGFITSINSYPANLVNEVMPDYKAALQELVADLDELIKVANYDDQFSAEYSKYVAEVYGATDLNAESEDLVASLKGNADEGIEGYDAWYTGLKNLISTIESQLGTTTADKIMTTLDDDMKAHMEDVYATLHGRVLAQIDIATELYAVISALNGKIDVLTVNNYSKYKKAFESIDSDTYNYLKDEAQNFTMPQETINKYNALSGDFTKFEDFIATGGFSSFAQQFIDYQNRDVLGTDLVRDEEFEVTKAKLEKVIASLDKAITSEEIGGLLGSLLGNEEGEAFNLGTMLSDTVKDMLFTDSFINTVFGALYPIIAEGLVGVWHKDIPNMAGGTDIAGMLNKNLYQIADAVGLALFPATVAKTLDSSKYADNIAKLNAADAEFRAAYPSNADDRYVQETINAEDGTVDEVKVIATPWKSAALFDESGETMTLTWGVDAAREKYENGEITQAEFETTFYEAFDDAFDGIRPLFRALIGDTKFEGNTVNVLNVGVGGANLSLNANGNAGYTNLLIPIYEALGAKVEGTEGATFTYEAPATIKDYASKSNSTALLLEAILAPIFSFLGEIGNAPLATLIEALPNLCYALSMQMVSPLLGMLKTTLEINIELTGLAAILGGCDSIPIDLSKPILYDLAVGGPDGLLKLDDVIDLSNGLNSLLSLLGLELPEIDQGLVAQLGEKTTAPTSRTEYIYTGLEGTGTAYTIKADKAAVGYYLLTYIFGIIEDEEAFKGLLSLLVTKEVPVLDENGQPTYDEEDNEVTEKVADEEKIEETLASFNEMGLFGHGTGNAIAAVVELFNQEENDNFAEYDWYEGAIYDGTTVTNLSPAMIQYLAYDNDWTQEKADYIVNNLDALIGAVFEMINSSDAAEGEEATEGEETEEAASFSVAAELNKLIGGLFTNKTVTALAKALGGLDLNALLAGGDEEAEGEDATEGEGEPEVAAEGDASEGGEGEAEAAPAIDITALIKDLLGVDLGAYAQYADLEEDAVRNWGFKDGDADGFTAALVALLEPLSPVIDFLLAGKNLEAIKDESGAVITLIGYNGYDTALVPLLEALGCEAPVLAADDNVLEVVLDTVFAKLNTITGEGADSIAAILDILPGVLYFLQSNALSAVVDNLLHGLYVILDTIRPIYDINLDQLIGDLTKDLGITIDLNNLDVNFLLGLVNNLVGLDLTDLGVLIADVCKVAVADYTSASSLIGENGKRGAYTEYFDAADLITVVLSFAFDWIKVADNKNALISVIAKDDAAMTEEIDKYITGIFALIEGIEPEYGEINWAYNFPEGFAEEDVIFSSGISIAPTIESLNYPTDWTEGTAKYLDENLDALIASALKMAGVEGTLSDMLKSNLNLFTGENLNKLVTLITDLLGSIDETLVSSVGVLLDADIEALKAYKAEKETYTAPEFAQELAKILGVIPEVVNWLFFGEDFALLNDKDGKDVITLKGSLGYAKGLAPILEALGCKNLPAADSKDVEGVLVSLANRFDEILNDPINEILNVLPNVIYFLNANGVSVSVRNMIAGVTGLMGAVKDAFGVELDLIAIINDALNGLLPEESTVEIDANNLDLETIFTLVEELLGLDLSAAAPILVDLCVGKIEPYTSLSGDYGFRMVYDDAYARYDMITILVTVALMLVENEQNAKALDELIGTEIMSGLKTVFESAPVVYATPDWDYCWAEDGIDYDNGTVDVMKYAITYPNNWTEESAKYIADNLGAIGDMVAGLIDSNYSTLGALVNDKVKIYSGENIDALVGAIAGLLGDIDDTLLKAAGLLLNVDIAGLKAYKAPAGIDTADEFAKELANVLTTYAGGLIDWLLFGKDYRFFVDETVVGDKYEEGEEIITINGGLGYANGLALLLEALGVDLTNAKTVEDILKATFARLDAILANPAVEVFNLLPNLLYFLNANGVAIAFDNLLAAVTTLLNKLAVFGVELDMAELINIEELLGIEEDLKISIDNLTVEAILELVAHFTGLDLELLEDVLVGFALGEVKEYTSVSRTGTAYKMYYNDEFAVYDMITVLANIVILTAKDEDNAEKLQELLGEDIYALLLNLFNMGEVPVQEFDWKFTDKADTGYVFSAISTSELYANHRYGPLYTEKMAQYIGDNIGEFIDNVIYLLGINIEGKSVDNLSELLNGLVNGSLYNSENVVAIRDALAGVLSGLADMDGGEHIVAVLKSSLGVDITAVAKVEVPEFTEDRAQFVTYLCNVLEPLYPVLKWLLANEDISFFVDLDKSDAITLPGAEGYAYGIIPLLEVLECENILATADYYEAVKADSDVILTSILTPLLDRVDVIMANPADEILGMLPNIIYFINSNGVDTVVKNTLNAVYTLLSAIEPIAKVDLYELIGIDLSTLTFEKLFDMLLDMIAESTGYEFTAMDASAVAELTVGTLESYTSLNGKKAYKMVYQAEGAEAEMVTVTMRLIVTFIMHENNQEILLGLLRDYLGMTADAEKYVRGVLKVVGECATGTYLGMDKALATLYYIYYGIDIGVGETANGIKDVNAEWTKVLENMRNSKDSGEALAGELITEILGMDIFEDIIDPEEGIAPNGFIAFFQKIAAFFQRIAEWFKNLFS